MTEKRYKLSEPHGAYLIDNDRPYAHWINDDDKIIDLLNDLVDENEELKQQLKTKVIVNKQYEELQRIKQENEEFKKALMELKEIGDYQEGRIKELSDENGQLKQRNNRQAKQLDRLYNLIEEKDWRTLTDILDDFKRCEEQLQREWKCYDD